MAWIKLRTAATARVTLYWTWRPSDHTTGLHGHDLAYSLSEPYFRISFCHTSSNFAECWYYTDFTWPYFPTAWGYGHMVGHAGSPICIAHADMTLTWSKVKVKSLTFSSSTNCTFLRWHHQNSLPFIFVLAEARSLWLWLHVVRNKLCMLAARTVSSLVGLSGCMCIMCITIYCMHV